MVQDFGLRLLQRQDNLAQVDDRIDRLRLALLSSGQRTIEDLYPEYFPGQRLEVTEDAPEDVLANPDTDYDFSGVAWESPGDMGPEQLAMLEEFLSDASATVYGSDLDEEPTEREWV